ncbi:MAG TPA: MFS transporter [Acidimicrobiia bacterium]|nr:MFS transporter [Acidimicrobiia bacterium]
MSRRPPLVFIFTVTLTGILNNTLVTPAIPDILSDFGVADRNSGLLVASGSVAGIIVAPLMGFLADRFGRRVVLTSCLAIFGGFGLLSALSPTFELLLLARLLQGVGSAGLINLAVVLIGDHWSGADRTRLVGRNASVLTVGLAFMPIVSGAVTQAAGWRVTFGLYTVALVTAAASFWVLDKGRPLRRVSAADQLRGAGEVIRQPEVATTLGVGFLVFVIIFGLFLSVFPLQLAQRFGMEAGARGILISVPALTSTLAAFNLGRIRAWLSVRAIVLLGGLGFALAFFLLGAASILPLLVVAALCHGASEGAFIPTLQDQAMEASPDDHRGAVVAVWVGFARLGQTVGPLLAGLALAVWSPGTTLMVGSALGVVIFVVALVGPLTRQRTGGRFTAEKGTQR